jgi:hypothetical protein
VGICWVLKGSFGISAMELKKKKKRKKNGSPFGVCCGEEEEEEEEEWESFLVCVVVKLKCVLNL